MSYAGFPLRRLHPRDRSEQYKQTLEARIMDVVHSLLTGPYEPAVMRLVKSAMLAPTAPDSPAIEHAPTKCIPPQFKDAPHNRPPSLVLLAAIQKSHGAFRILRSLIRRSLSTRMARAYIGREVNNNMGHAGGPTKFDLDGKDLEQELLERAWGTSTTNLLGPVGWAAVTVGKSMKEGVKSWVEFEAPRHTQGLAVVHTGTEEGGITAMRGRIEAARERVLEEAASLVRDIFHELDEREDAGSAKGRENLSPEEAVAVGGTVYELAQWLKVIKYVFVLFSDFTKSSTHETV